MKENQCLENFQIGVADIIKMESKLIEKDIGMMDEIIELLKNLISMESHAQSSFKTTRDKRFLKAKDDIRKIRTIWLDTITKKNFGQIWCYNKHSFESLMRLDEIQSRFLSSKQEKEAIECSKHYEKIFNWIIELNDMGGNLDVSETKSSA